MEKLKNKEDTELVVLYQSGNKEVLALLVKRWHVQFCKLAYWYCKDKDIAKDIAQESWVVIFRKLENLNQPNKFKSWAISIVNHKALDWIRKTNRDQKKLHKLYDESPEISVEDHQDLDSNSLSKKMKFEIENLPEHLQVVLKLFYLEEYSLKQIGELLSISIGTAKSRLFHARERLKKKMKKHKKEY